METTSKTLIIAILTVSLILVSILLGSNFLRPREGNDGIGDKVTITGSGSSFIAPQMYAWANQIKEENDGLIVEYESIGSGAGLSNFMQELKDFGASDPPLPRNIWEKYQGKIIQMPIVLGAVVIVYNIPGVDKPLNLTGEVLARIYNGEIRYWDDPQIISLNQRVSLPHKEIVVVHRSDASGTTQIFTTFLYKSAPNVWSEHLVGKTIDWPVDSTGRGVGAKGNEGVTRTIMSTPYSIGYIEWSYAIDSKLPIASIQNARGEFIQPSIGSIQKAALNLPLPETPLGDYSRIVNSLVYPDTEGAYPLASFTFLFFWTEYSHEKVEAIKEFIKYLNTIGQEPENIVEGYAPIPGHIKKINLKALDIIKSKE